MSYSSLHIFGRAQVILLYIDYLKGYSPSIEIGIANVLRWICHSYC